MPKLEIVINRYESRALGVSEEHITKALTRPAQWKIPNDYAGGAEHADQRHAAGAFGLADRAADPEMASAVTGKSDTATKKKKKASAFSDDGLLKA